MTKMKDEHYAPAITLSARGRQRCARRERDRIFGGWMAGRRPAREWLYPQIAQLKEVDRSVALLLLDGFSCKAIAATSALQRATWA